MGEAARTKIRVVIGVDFSESSTHAIFEAVHLARLAHSVDLHFVHVLADHAPADGPHRLDALSERLGRTMIKLERYVRDALFVFGGRDTWGCDVAFHLRVGPVDRALHQLAVDVDADMIIVGADQRRGLRRLFTRSATKALVRDAHVPVIVAHPKDFRGLERTQRTSETAGELEDLTRSGLTSYTYVDFGETQREGRLRGLS